MTQYDRLTDQQEDIIIDVSKQFVALFKSNRQKIIDTGITLNEANSMVGTAISLACFDIEEKECPQFISGLASALLAMS